MLLSLICPMHKIWSCTSHIHKIYHTLNCSDYNWCSKFESLIVIRSLVVPGTKYLNIMRYLSKAELYYRVFLVCIEFYFPQWHASADVKKIHIQKYTLKYTCL